jgi:cell division protein FtsB
MPDNKKSTQETEQQGGPAQEPLAELSELRDAVAAAKTEVSALEEIVNRYKAKNERATREVTERQQRIEALEAEIAALRTDNARLTALVEGLERHIEALRGPVRYHQYVRERLTPSGLDRAAARVNELQAAGWTLAYEHTIEVDGEPLQVMRFERADKRAETIPFPAAAAAAGPGDDDPGEENDSEAQREDADPTRKVATGTTATQRRSLNLPDRRYTAINFHERKLHEYGALTDPRSVVSVDDVYLCRACGQEVHAENIDRHNDIHHGGHRVLMVPLTGGGDAA